MTSGFCGSMATDTKWLSDEWFSVEVGFSGEMRSQVAPPSRERKTPSSAPITKMLWSLDAMAMDRMDLPCAPISSRQVRPLSSERKTPPSLSSNRPQAAAYLVAGLLG